MANARGRVDHPARSPRPIDVAPIIADVDVDGHLDVLVGAGGTTYVAHGDGAGLAVAVPYHLPLSNPNAVSPDIPMPLAAADFTGDGVVDFVFGDGLLVSLPPLQPGALPRYATDQFNVASRWTSAKIVDLNANGKLDVVAASNGGLDIAFFNGTGTEHLTPFSIPTDRPVEQLAVSDFDGDLVRDIAFIESAPRDERNPLLIAFGAPSGPPQGPTTVARIARAEQLTVYDESELGNIVISSTESVQGQESGAFTFLDGSGDRNPYAPISLTTLTSGTVANSISLGLAVGRFTSSGQYDVLALASDNLVEKSWELWLVPGIGLGKSLPQPLPGKLDPKLSPASMHSDIPNVNLASAAADFDGDGRDEAFMAMPAEVPEHCAVLLAGSSGGDVTSLSPRAPLWLDEPCSLPELQAVDADGDGHLDIALLTGAPGAPNRKLLVLWNDGLGGFSSADVTQVNDPADSPASFTTLRATPDRPFGFVYVAARGAVWIASASAGSARTFAAPRTLASMTGGTGIVGADVNGDGVDDLVVAADGNLIVLLARLVAQ